MSRIAVFFALGFAHRPDLWESEAIATSVAEGHGFVYQFLGTTHRSYLEPLYPALCASLHMLTGHSFVALGVAQALLGSADYIEGRHRLAIEPLLLILTGMALSSLSGRGGQFLPLGKTSSA